MTKNTNPFRNPYRVLALVLLPALAAVAMIVLAAQTWEVQFADSVGSDGRIVVTVGGTR